VAFSAHISLKNGTIRMILTEKVFIDVFFNAFSHLNHVDWTIIGGDIVLLRYQSGRHVLPTIFLSKVCMSIIPLFPALIADWLLTDGAS
jgi:hypothetical protein